MILAGDPVETGIVPSLARPGRKHYRCLSDGCRRPMEKVSNCFRDMLPSVRRVAVLRHATNPAYARAMLDEVQRAGGPTERRNPAGRDGPRA